MAKVNHKLLEFAKMRATKKKIEIANANAKIV